MNTKLFSAIALLISLVISLPACMNSTTETHSPLKAWQGEFSEEKLKEAITEYEKDYAPIPLSETGTIILSLDENIDSCRVTRVSYVEEDFGELENYIDTHISVEYDQETKELTIDCSFLNAKTSWVSTKPLWSLLIKAETTSAEVIYYYVRTAIDSN